MNPGGRLLSHQNVKLSHFRQYRRFNIGHLGPCYNFCQCRRFNTGRKPEYFCVPKGGHT
ncbi:hypothetical protein DAPPUDRAFT_257952 [Daphnia pulex]|uniref:Uncharacterized protein n=1 Tax=Daphnia pulex TaxID=6669 RepID=E9HEI3_DAPPU|nr:hypothetical protein DAPPUDRAFT_257952 [Daphnia pulex]|eukprot:EFX69851.1 hypothetical protein DAPPUDRAFT_257952 [Daphnia pulex]